MHIMRTENGFMLEVEKGETCKYVKQDNKGEKCLRDKLSKL